MAIHEVTVLLIEDEPEIRRFLRTSLPAHGYRLYEATTGADGLAQAKARNPDIILLDLGLPDVDGTEVIRQVREWSTIPILVLSAREQEQAKVAALDLGADDYVTKPFGVNELLARMRAALRHIAGPAGRTGRAGVCSRRSEGGSRTDDRYLCRRKKFTSRRSNTSCSRR